MWKEWERLNEEEIDVSLQKQHGRSKTESFSLQSSTTYLGVNPTTVEFCFQDK